MLTSRKKKILLVEDESIIAMIEARTIQGFGYEVITAPSGEKAVPLATVYKEHDQAVDLVLMDINLGRGMDGTQAAQEILRQREVPIVFLTSHAERDMVEKVKGITRYGYVIKNSGDFVLQSSIEMAFELFEAHQKVKASELKYRTAADFAFDWEWWMGSDGQYVYISPSCERITGYPPQAFIDNPQLLIAILHPEDRERFGRHDEQSPAVLEDAVLEFRIITSSGEERWIGHTCQPVYSPQGEYLGRRAGNRDITERKRAEQAHRRSEEKFYKAFYTSPDSININRLRDGLYLECNEGFQALTGYTPEEVIGRTSLALDIWVDPQDRARLVQGLCERGEVINLEAPFRGKFGQVKTCLMSAKIIDVDGEPCILSITRDISERKRTEQALQESEARWHLSVENMIEGYGLHEAIFAENGRMVDYRFVEFNPAAQKITNVTQEEIVRKTALELFPHVKERGLLDRYADVMATGKPAHLEDFYYSGDKLDKALDITCYRVDERHFACVFRDVTGHKRAEQALKESEARFRSYVKHAPMGIFVVGADGRHVETNPVASQMLGYSEAEIMQRSIADILHPDALEAGWQHFKRVFQQGYDTGEIPLRRKDGALLWAAVQAVCLNDNRLIAFCQDISGRKRMETERNTLLEIMQGLVVTEDLQEYLGFVHRAVARVIYAENFSLVLKNKNTGLFEDTYFVDKYDSLCPPSLLEKSISAYVFRTGEPLLLTLERFDELIAQGEVELVGTDSLSWLGVPLIASQEKIGVMMVQDYETAGRYSEHDKEFLVSIAGQVALAVERKRAEQEIQRLLMEKELLLQEVHHRVKNNMVAIASLLELQADTVAVPETIRALQDASGRVKSMLAIYDRLYRSGNYQSIDLRTYLESLVDDITQSWDYLGGKITLIKEIEEIEISARQSFPLGIIVHEWLTNAFKYAFPRGRRGEISVAAHRRGENLMEVCVSDNGVGLPKGVDVHNPTTFGLSLVQILVQQIDGSLRVEREGGVAHMLVFPLANGLTGV